MNGVERRIFGMTMANYKTALIVGAGVGISASVARLLARRGVKVAVAARDAEKRRFSPL